MFNSKVCGARQQQRHTAGQVIYFVLFQSVKHGTVKVSRMLQQGSDQQMQGEGGGQGRTISWDIAGCWIRWSTAIAKM